MNAYCVMCRTGNEKNIAQEISQVAPLLKVIAPIRILQEKRNVTWRNREKPLLPGYVFVYAQADDMPMEKLRRIRNMYKVLTYGQGLRRLQNEDYDYAMWLYRHQGEIASSRVLAEGQNVVAIEGPLTDVNGTIIRFDKQKRRVWVEFNFDGHKRIVSLSAEWITACDRDKVPADFC